MAPDKGDGLGVSRSHARLAMASMATSPPGVFPQAVSGFSGFILRIGQHQRTVIQKCYRLYTVLFRSRSP